MDILILSIKRKKFFERQKTVPALACDFEREVFLLYAKIASRDRLLLLYNFLRQRVNAAGVIRDSYEDVKVG